MLIAVKQAIASLPVPVSPRSFRLAAKRLDLNYLDRAQMMVKEEDIPTILKELGKCRTIARNKALAKRR
jgi:hypothetical protein